MSYANHVEQRVIHNSGSIFNVNKGRLRFEHIWASNPQRRIGGLLKLRNGDRPILKTYVDGTALFRRNMLNNFNYPTATSIEEVVYKYYKVIRDVTENDDHYQLLQYKLLPETTRHFKASGSFSDFLAEKYNTKGEENDTL